MGRPQDKNLKLFGSGAFTPEEEHAIRSKGGKACHEANKRRKAMAELLQIYADLPITNKKVAKQLKNMGFSEDDLTQKLEVANAIMKRAKGGDFYHVQMFLELTGEMGNGGNGKENNLLSAIVNSTAEEVDVSDLPEIQQETESDSDLVE